MITPVLPTYNRAPLAFVKGEGSWLWAEDGSRYLDLGAGIGAALSNGGAFDRVVTLFCSVLATLPPFVIGMALIVTGVVVMQAFSKSAGH